MRTALITVGSTHFDDLIRAFEPEGAVFKALEEAHFERLILQYGKGTSPQTSSPSGRLQIDAFRFNDEIDKLVASSDLVISHAGESLALYDPLLNADPIRERNRVRVDPYRPSCWTEADCGTQHVSYGQSSS